MVARTGLVMAVYVAVGMVLALGQAIVAPERMQVDDGLKVAAERRMDAPGDQLVGAPQMLEVAAPSATSGTTATTLPTTTSTIPWSSGRLDGSTSESVPVSIEIPSLDIEAEVVQTGVDPDSHQMAIPASPAEVGWYRFGPRPGDQGSAVLAGHVDMAGYGPGAFFELDRLTPGNRVFIEMSDGSRREFEVVETTRVAKADLDLAAVFDNTGPARLTLITCGGAFNRTERTYLDNVVSHLRPVGLS